MNEKEKESVINFEIPLDHPIDLVALAVKDRAIRCSILGSGEHLTLRCAVRDEVEGEILTVKPSKLWQFKETIYLSGEIESSRLDIPALNLKPLALKGECLWNPNDAYWGEPGEEIEPYFKPIIDFGPRLSYEMEQIIPFEDPQDDIDPISEAVEYHEGGATNKAKRIIEEILTVDLRCLDAHAHLGNWSFNLTNNPSEYLIKEAKRHYEVGIKIGELSFAPNFNGLLPWNRIDNRPFLRCLHGYGLCLWRLGEPEEARKIFEKMLWLNPADNQGIRFLLANIDAGRSWQSED